MIAGICPRCQRPVLTLTVAGKTTVLDAEPIEVVPDDVGRKVVTARRLHGETCVQWERELAREKLRAERAEWEREQQAKPPGDRKGR